MQKLLWTLTKLVERTNEVSLVGRGGGGGVLSGDVRADRLPFWESSLAYVPCCASCYPLASVWFFLMSATPILFQ